MMKLVLHFILSCYLIKENILSTKNNSIVYDQRTDNFQLVNHLEGVCHCIGCIE